MVVMIQFVALSVFKSNTQKERGKLLKGFLSHVLQSKIKVKHPAETPGNAVTAETATLSDFSQCDQTSASSTCARSVILELSAFSREKVFPSSLWFIQYLANLALNLPHEISSHFSPPLPAYVNYMPPQPSSIPTCFFSLCFRNSPAWRMRNRPLEGGSGSLSAQCVGPPHPVWVTHWSQCAALSWVHRRAFMVRWDSNECLWGLSGSQRAGTIPAFTATLMGSLLVVWACFKLG